MGGSLCPVFDPVVPEAYPWDEIRTLFLHLSDVDTLARELSVRPLGSFLSNSEPGSEAAAISWFPVEEALETVRALAAAVQEAPHNALPWTVGVEHEFRELEHCLTVGSRQSSRFRFVIA